MQEEMTSQSIALSAKTVEVTIDVLKKLFDIYLDNQKKNNHLGKLGKGINQPKVKRGKQSVRQLLGQGQGAENIEINSDNIGLFTSSARRHGVDFAMTRAKAPKHPFTPCSLKERTPLLLQPLLRTLCSGKRKKSPRTKSKALPKSLKN